MACLFCLLYSIPPARVNMPCGRPVFYRGRLCAPTHSTLPLTAGQVWLPIAALTQAVRTIGHAKARQRLANTYPCNPRDVTPHDASGQSGTTLSQGLRAYRAQRWEEAIALLQEVFQEVPDDPPSQLYIPRCRECLATPPTTNWDGIYVMQTQ